ncbi:MAG: ImmA/IrrE family metallo-endopeptidase [Pyrinomonadaceae bacterium]
MFISDLPPGEKWQNYELKALSLRDFARVSANRALDPFSLARYANLIVVSIDQVEGLSDSARRHLLGAAVDEWSGGACSLPNGAKLVVLNRQHPRTRTNATLMEEICHVFLGHKPNRLSVVVRDERGKHLNRDYRKADEEAAYAVGAACLVPFKPLRRFVYPRKTSADIARHFRVSRDLVEYRIKVTRLWPDYRSRLAAHKQIDEK